MRVKDCLLEVYQNTQPSSDEFAPSLSLLPEEDSGKDGRFIVCGPAGGQYHVGVARESNNISTGNDNIFEVDVFVDGQVLISFLVACNSPPSLRISTPRNLPTSSAILLCCAGLAKPAKQWGYTT
jgi:hypothetical protein